MNERRIANSSLGAQERTVGVEKQYTIDAKCPPADARNVDGEPDALVKKPSWHAARDPHRA